VIQSDIIAKKQVQRRCRYEAMRLEHLYVLSWWARKNQRSPPTADNTALPLDHALM
jgi:hypothetical protein